MKIGKQFHQPRRHVQKAVFRQVPGHFLKADDVGVAHDVGDATEVADAVETETILNVKTDDFHDTL